MFKFKKSPAEKFREKKRDIPNNPRKVRCLNPFRWLEVSDGGAVSPCCTPWFKGNLGTLENQTMEEIWNGPKFQELREAMYEGGNWQKFCNAKTCPQIINDIWTFVDYIDEDTPDQLPITQSMLDDIREGKTEMSEGPAQIGVSCDPRCNLRCKMCSTLTNPNRDGKALAVTLEGIDHFVDSIHTLKMMGDGEVFSIPESRDFLFNFDTEAHPNVDFHIISNGTLITPSLWERIKHLNISKVFISMDAACKETYEKIRVNGRWDKLIANIKHLLERKEEGAFEELHINMCVMRSNHREMIEFAEMAIELGVTSGYFLQIFGDYPEEQIFSPPDRDCIKRVVENINHPIMKNPIIDTSSIENWRDWNG